MHGEQRSDDDVTRYVSYDSPFTGLGRMSLSGSRPDRQDQQQTEHHPGGLRHNVEADLGFVTKSRHREALTGRTFLLAMAGVWKRRPSGIYL